MKLDRLPYEPSSLANFFEHSLTLLGALCDRTWHNRLQVLADGVPAKLWNEEGKLVETELQFTPPGENAPRDASREIFPGCPLLFHLCEMLSPRPLTLHRAACPFAENTKAPAPEVAEKLWRHQFPTTHRWQLESGFIPAWVFSLLALIRAEFQAIDQHWSLHRLALSLPKGEVDEPLCRNLEFTALGETADLDISWPVPDPTAWQALLMQACQKELATNLESIRQRQEHYLRRELDRVDAYFFNYDQELRCRAERSRTGQSQARFQERMAAAKLEHERRRQDQLKRHEVRVILHLDALLLLAEPAWQARFLAGSQGAAASKEALFIPRTRSWKL